MAPYATMKRMRRALRVSIVVVAVLAAIVAGAGVYLLGRTPVPETSTYSLDLNEIRRLAGAIPGERPLRVNHERVAEAPLPRGAVFAGESLRTPHPMVHGA